MKRLFESFRRYINEEDDEVDQHRMSKLVDRYKELDTKEKEFDKQMPPIPDDKIGAEIVLQGEYRRVYGDEFGDLTQRDFDDLNDILMHQASSSESIESHIESVFHPIHSMSRHDVLETTTNPRHFWAKTRKDLSIKLFEIWAEKIFEQWPADSSHWGSFDEEPILNKLGHSRYGGYAHMRDIFKNDLVHYMIPGRKKRGVQKEAKLSIMQAKDLLENVSKNIHFASLQAGPQGYILAMKALQEVEYAPMSATSQKPPVKNIPNEEETGWDE